MQIFTKSKNKSVKLPVKSTVEVIYIHKREQFFSFFRVKHVRFGVKSFSKGLKTFVFIESLLVIVLKFD